MASNHWCGEYKSNDIVGGYLRPQLMKLLKEAGVKVNIKWTVDEMRAKLEEANERQKAEAANGQSEETEGSH